MAIDPYGGIFVGAVLIEEVHLSRDSLVSDTGAVDLVLVACRVEFDKPQLRL